MQGEPCRGKAPLCMSCFECSVLLWYVVTKTFVGLQLDQRAWACSMCLELSDGMKGQDIVHNALVLEGFASDYKHVYIACGTYCCVSQTVMAAVP